MIDNITVELPINLPMLDSTLTEFIVDGYRYVPVFNKSNGSLRYFGRRHDNLEVRIYPNGQKMIIRNSMHKYWKGNNHSDYTLTDISSTIQKLSDELHQNIFTGKIKKIEYGCNLLVDDPDLVVAKLDSYRSKKFQAMEYNGQTYGAKCFFSQYTIKGYNKTTEYLLHEKKALAENVFRWEAGVNVMAALHKRKIPLTDVKDLSNYETMQYIVKDVCDRYTAVNKKYTPDYKRLSLNQLTAYTRMNDRNVSAIIKKNHPETFRGDRTKYNAILKTATSESDNTGELLKNKMSELLNS